MLTLDPHPNLIELELQLVSTRLPVASSTYFLIPKSIRDQISIPRDYASFQLIYWLWGYLLVHQ
jgi:hypothetical protein